MNFTQTDIIQYYEQCENAYRDAWGMDQNLQLNLGLWEKDTKNLAEALSNLNAKIADLAKIDENSMVLDAGCGVGGTAIYLAKHFGCKVVGISITERQVVLAKENAKAAGVDHLVDFETQNFMKTNFKEETFDAVIGMESICYAEPKLDFLKEAKRVLKPGGRLVLAENLQGKAELSARENSILYQNGFNGCKVISLDTEADYRRNLHSLDFKAIECIDKSKAVRPSIVRLRRFFYPAWLYNQWHRLIGKAFSETQEANTKMCYYLLTGLDRGLWKYGLIKAVK
jgi:cyclopropane fatty-acyl-phospholipid synthase-like methyltransferase